MFKNPKLIEIKDRRIGRRRLNMIVDAVKEWYLNGNICHRHLSLQTYLPGETLFCGDSY